MHNLMLMRVLERVTIVRAAGFPMQTNGRAVANEVRRVLPIHVFNVQTVRLQAAPTRECE